MKRSPSRGGRDGAQLESVVETLSALAHPARLKVFRLLMAEGPDGVRAGAIAARLSIAPSNLTAHLNILSQAGLLTQRAVGRARIYAVDVAAMSALLRFLVSDCCGGHPEVCAELGLSANAARC